MHRNEPEPAPRAGNPLVRAAVLMQHHPRPRRQLAPPTVRHIALPALDRAVLLKLGPDPVVASGTALPSAKSQTGQFTCCSTGQSTCSQHRLSRQ